MDAAYLNAGDFNTIQVTFSLTWEPPKPDPNDPNAPDYNPAQTQYLADLAAYEKQVAAVQRSAYAKAVRERLKLVSAMRPRPSDDLRSEERHTVYGGLIKLLSPIFPDPYFNAEMLRQTFEVDEMLYFVPQTIGARVKLGRRSTGTRWEGIRCPGPRGHRPRPRSTTAG
ncbi:hypothetical protein [Streptomyces stelliscabiei]|uniref:hypothetical protein n=1 Tax=Streptomyces stelliscabiei TaxID=146820 RepID=UPI002FF2E3EC